MERKTDRYGADNADDDEYRRVYGVRFKQPSDPYNLNEKGVTDDKMNFVWLMISAIPVVGVSIPIACLTSGYARRHTNDFRIYEQAWKVGIYATVLQTVSFLLFLLATSPV